jgi:hypothetical protein
MTSAASALGSEASPSPAVNFRGATSQDTERISPDKTVVVVAPAVALSPVPGLRCVVSSSRGSEPAMPFVFLALTPS